MLFWLLALVVTAIACAALYLAGAGRRAQAPAAAEEPAELGHLRLQLKEIESDAALGRLEPAEALAARAEVAREVMRVKAESGGAASGKAMPRQALVGMAIAATAVLTFGVYSAIGRPDLPALPLETRTDIPPADMTLEDAVAKIEARLKEVPDDVRGWTVVVPAYMQMGRYADAAAALRKVIELDGPTADRETDLGEALMMEAGGNVEGEPLKLFEQAAARDPGHVRSRYYIASEANRRGEFDVAKSGFEALIALGKGDEPWMESVKAGLAAAQAGIDGTDAPMIAGMVEGLSQRLSAEGGSIEEWTRLVRSRLVLGHKDLAQTAYDAARKAYPDAAVRTELDVLAADNGLVAN